MCNRNNRSAQSLGMIYDLDRYNKLCEDRARRRCAHVVMENELLGKLATRDDYRTLQRAEEDLASWEGELVDLALQWLEQFRPTDILHPYSTYKWKHICERQVPGGYVSESAFALALVLAGFSLRQAPGTDGLFVQTNLPASAEKEVGS
jgi:hypothetical protein